MFTTEQFSLTAFIIVGLQKLNPYTHLITDGFLMLTILLLALAIYKRHSYFTQIAPTLLGSVALLGIFLGTTIALSVFERQPIETSLLHFKNGLSMAFITGLAGLFSALLIKLLNNYQKKQSEHSSAITPTDIYRVLTEISEHNANQKAYLSNLAETAHTYQQQLQETLSLQQNGFDQEKRLLTEFKNSLIGEHENSLAAQIQKLRFSTEKIAQESHQDLVQVIESPMKSFTHTMGEQFWDHFEQFNQAAQALRRMPDDYHEQMVKMHVTLENLATHLKTLPQTLQQLAQTIQGLHQQLEKIRLHSENFQSLDKKTGQNGLILSSQKQHRLELLDSSLETQLEEFKAPQNCGTNLESQPLSPSIPPNAETALGSAVDEIMPTLEVSKPPNPDATHPSPPRQNASQLACSSRTTTTALPILDEPEDNNQTDYEALQSQAFAFMESGHYQKAISYFEQAIAINPEQFSLFYNKACCYGLLGQIDLAITSLKYAIYLNAECFEMAKTDSDFDKIRYDTRFSTFILGD